MNNCGEAFGHELKLLNLLGVNALGFLGNGLVGGVSCP